MSLQTLQEKCIQRIISKPNGGLSRILFNMPYDQVRIVRDFMLRENYVQYGYRHKKFICAICKLCNLGHIEFGFRPCGMCDNAYCDDCLKIYGKRYKDKYGFVENNVLVYYPIDVTPEQRTCTSCNTQYRYVDALCHLCFESPKCKHCRKYNK